MAHVHRDALKLAHDTAMRVADALTDIVQNDNAGRVHYLSVLAMCAGAGKLVDVETIAALGNDQLRNTERRRPKCWGRHMTRSNHTAI